VPQVHGNHRLSHRFVFVPNDCDQLDARIQAFEFQYCSAKDARDRFADPRHLRRCFLLVSLIHTGQWLDHFFLEVSTLCSYTRQVSIKLLDVADNPQTFEQIEVETEPLNDWFGYLPKRGGALGKWAYICHQFKCEQPETPNERLKRHA